MRRIPATFVIAALLSPFPTVLLAKTKHAPLPDQVLQAKTLYIDNQSGVADIGDKAYDEVTKWGRFKIVSTAKDADVVLLLSAGAYVSGYNTRSTGTADGGSVDIQSHTTAEVGQTTYLTVIDPRTGTALWADQRSNGGGRGNGGATGVLTSILAAHAAANAVRGLVKELRERIDEQEGIGKK